jgi:acetyltransferase-like isoleucine patch superfamily enzyme
MGSGLREGALRARNGVRRARFELWVAQLRAQLLVRGGRLIVDAPHGVEFDEPPQLRIKSGGGDGDGTFTLRVGRRVTFGRGIELEIWAGATNVLELGDYAFVMNNAQLSLRGGAIRMAEHASIRTGSVVKSEGELTLGRYAGVSNYCVVHCCDRITFEDYAGTADRVTIADSEKLIDGGDTYFLDQPLATSPVHIGRNTFIASNAVVTAGTRIGPNAVVGANAVLTGKSYAGGWIIGGIPAKPLRALPVTQAAIEAAEAAAAAEAVAAATGAVTIEAPPAA